MSEHSWTGGTPDDSSVRCVRCNAIGKVSIVVRGWDLHAVVTIYQVHTTGILTKVAQGAVASSYCPAADDSKGGAK